MFLAIVKGKKGVNKEISGRGNSIEYAAGELSVNIYNELKDCAPRLAEILEDNGVKTE